VPPLFGKNKQGACRGLWPRERRARLAAEKKEEGGSGSGKKRPIPWPFGMREKRRLRHSRKKKKKAIWDGESERRSDRCPHQEELAAVGPRGEGKRKEGRHFLARKKELNS